MWNWSYLSRETVNITLILGFSNTGYIWWNDKVVEFSWPVLSHAVSQGRSDAPTLAFRYSQFWRGPSGSKLPEDHQWTVTLLVSQLPFYSQTLGRFFAVYHPLPPNAICNLKGFPLGSIPKRLSWPTSLALFSAKLWFKNKSSHTVWWNYKWTTLEFIIGFISKLIYISSNLSTPCLVILLPIENNDGNSHTFKETSWKSLRPPGEFLYSRSVSAVPEYVSNDGCICMPYWKIMFCKALLKQISPQMADSL